MRSERILARTSLTFLAGMICGAGVAALFDSQHGGARKRWLRSTVGDPLNSAASQAKNGASMYLATVRNQTVPDDKLKAIVEERMKELCDYGNVSIDVRDGHVTVWRGLTHQDASRIANQLHKIPAVSSFYVQPDDDRDVREINEDGVGGRERRTTERPLAA